MKKLFTGCLKFVLVLGVIIIGIFAFMSTSPVTENNTVINCETPFEWAITEVTNDPEVMNYNSLSNFRMILSDEPTLGIGTPGVYFIAADITGPDLNETLVWVTNGDYMIYSADNLTAEFSQFPVIGQTDSPVSTDSYGYDEVKKCS